MKATILWTVLPRGVLANGDLSLSIHASPRLLPDGASAPLSAFHDLQDPASASTNWASHQFSFGLVVDDGAPTPLPRRRPRPYVTVRADPEALDPVLWGKLFADVSVRGHKPRDLRGRRIRSFPVGHVRDFVRERTIAAALASPDELPQLPGRKGPYGGLDFTQPERRAKLGELLDARLTEHGYIPAGDPDPTLDFFQALVFHGFKGRDYDAPIHPPKIDFHSALALLADYPALLRRLGLVFDLVVKAPAHGFTRMRVVPSFGPSSSPAGVYEAVTPWTAITYAAGATFEATPAVPSERRGGFLDLRRPAVQIDQVDVDGAALKSIQFAETSASLETKGSFGAPSHGGLPALRSGGIAVSLVDRAGHLKRTIDANGALEDAFASGGSIVLQAEALTRGLRFDVLDTASGRWHSLHRRAPRLTITTGDSTTPISPPLAEEEGVLTASVTAPTDPAKGDDLYLHETLCRWNGWSLSVERPGKRVDRRGHGIADSANPAVNALGLAAAYTVAPGSLPRLRFGARYRLRARLVDIAGNSLPWESEDGTAASAEVPYLRFDPVAAPTLSREAEPRPGESIERLVIRSFNAAPELDAIASAESTARGVFPPRTSVLGAEQHGLLDGPGGVMGDPATYAKLAARDPVQPPEVTATPTSAVPRPLDAIHYLPDPLAVGVHLRDLPGAGGPLDLDCAAATWPDVQPLRIVLAEGSGAPQWDEAARTLTIALAKGETRTIRLSSRLPGDEALTTLGVWRWIAEHCPPGWAAEARRRALAGELWQLTPSRTLTLVHAVQQPLRQPAFAALRARRAAGETHANLLAELLVDAKSTGKVDVLARWQDRVDDLSDPGGAAWEAREGQVAAPIIDDPRLDTPAYELRHELGDTRYRRVAYHLVATSRYREHFLPDDGGPLPDLTRVDAEPTVLDVLSSARPAAPLVEYAVPTFGWERSSAADGLASRRRGQGVRVYLSRPWFSSGDGELLGVLVAHGPRVTYDKIDPDERSWLAGEVVPELPEALRRCATGWGSDPIWAGATTWPTPSLHHFPGKVAQRQDLELEELPSPSKSPWSLAVAGHEVAFDASRGLWFCDLELDTGDAYFPFVRLALCRFQPRSVDGVEVSRVVLADFIQLAPERLAWIGSDPNDRAIVRLSLSGPANRGSAASPIATVVSARVEVFAPTEGGDGDGDEDAGRWLPDESPPSLLAQTQITGTVALWSGELRLPRPRGELRQRLIVEEYELLPREARPGLSAFAPATAPGRRLVYADAIEL